MRRQRPTGSSRDVALQQYATDARYFRSLVQRAVYRAMKLHCVNWVVSARSRQMNQRHNPFEGFGVTPCRAPTQCLVVGGTWRVRPVAATLSATRNCHSPLAVAMTVGNVAVALQHGMASLHSFLIRHMSCLDASAGGAVPVNGAVGGCPAAAIERGHCEPGNRIASVVNGHASLSTRDQVNGPWELSLIIIAIIACSANRQMPAMIERMRVPSRNAFS
jgi:hypothetical protein